MGKALPLTILAAAAVHALPRLTAAQTPAPRAAMPTSAPLTLEPLGAQAAKLGSFPIRVRLTAEKPAAIHKEPAYRAAPRYATIRVGDGPHAAYTLVVDEPEDGAWRIYVDRNRNGDLTDDSDGSWGAKAVIASAGGERTRYGFATLRLKASWGSADRETGTGEYGLTFWRFSDEDDLWMRREGARVGSLLIDGKSHKVMLVENDGDAVFEKRIETDEKGKPRGGEVTTRPLWLLLDLNDDGRFVSAGQAARLRLPSEEFDLRGPFTLNGRTYEATVVPDGSRITLTPTARAVLDLTVEPPKLLAPGTTAPDFVAEAWDGGSLRLAGFRGKVVILDFWATWCGPCQRSMPHIETLAQSLKGQEVVVLAVCVSDDRRAYQKWMSANKDKYSFTFAFDPAARATRESVARKLYNVSGIPTTYVIDKDGRIVEAILGYEGEKDKRLSAALAKAGVTVSAEVAGR